MKHTKGPWEFYNAKDTTCYDDLKNADERTFRVYGNSFGNTVHHVATGIGEEDVNLIAAAPELLEALENILNVHAYTGFVDDKALEQAENAIAKAKGE